MNSVRTAALDCFYLESGPRDGDPVFLVHGFPDDATTWARVTGALTAAGYRTIAPFVRGFGPTRLHPEAMRTGEIGAVAHDVLALADALDITTFHYVGHDWGARAGYVVAALAPSRVRTLAALAVAYGTNVAGQRLDVAQMRAYWYQWYFATPRGEAALESERFAFCRDLWRTWSPGWNVSDAEYAATAASFENPDFVALVIHSYRQRWGFSAGDPALTATRALVASVPSLDVPTLVLMGAADGATLPSSLQGTDALFTGPYSTHVIPHCGHFVQREAPERVIAALLPHLAQETGGRAGEKAL